jgi:phosphatidate cytidylyltransferase
VNNLLTRTASGAVYVLFMLGSLFLGPYAFAGLLLVLVILSLMEYRLLAEKLPGYPALWTMLPAGILLYIAAACFFLGLTGREVLMFTMLPVFALFIAGLYRKKGLAFVNMALELLSLIYIVLPLSLLNGMLHLDVAAGMPARSLVLAFLVFAWTGDTFAYLTGRWLGKHKMYERISPRKTWEGFFGGLVFSVVSSVIFASLYTQISLSGWIMYAILVVITGTFGDLTESMLKRNADVKDSGNLIPGHGGILDRLDSILLAAPFAYLYLRYAV